MTQPQVWQGTWEEISGRAEELAGTGKRVMLIVPPDEEILPILATDPAPATPNEQMLTILRGIKGRHRNRPSTDGADTPRLLDEARAGGMYGGGTADG